LLATTIGLEENAWNKYRKNEIAANMDQTIVQPSWLCAWHAAESATFLPRIQSIKLIDKLQQYFFWKVQFDEEWFRDVDKAHNVFLENKPPSTTYWWKQCLATNLVRYIRRWKKSLHMTIVPEILP
jgi:hypothetical protein